MVDISHFITWHVAVERQCLYTFYSKGTPLSFPICSTLSKESTCLVWGVCVCMHKYICVRVCVRTCHFALHFSAIFWQYEVGIPFFCKTPPPQLFPLWLHVFTTVFRILLSAVSCWMWCRILIWRDSVSLWYIDTT